MSLIECPPPYTAPPGMRPVIYRYQFAPTEPGICLDNDRARAAVRKVRSNLSGMSTSHPRKLLSDGTSVIDRDAPKAVTFRASPDDAERILDEYGEGARLVIRTELNKWY